MADIFLKSGETFTGVANSSNFYGKGGANTETAGITSAAVGSTFDGNVEVVTIDASSNDLKFQQVGNQLKVFTLADVLVATITVQDDANGTRLNFANGTDVEAKFDGSVLELNGAPVSATSGTVDIPNTDDSITGQTFTLTENADQLTGQLNGLIGSKGTVSTAGDDIIIAGTSVNGGIATNNLGSGDNVNGGAGTDTLKILFESTTDGNLLPTLTAVEIVEAQNITTGDDLQINLTNSTGYQQLWAANTPAGTGANVIFNDIRENATIGAKDYLGASVGAAFAAGALTSGELSIASENSDTFFDISTVEAVDVLNVSATIGKSAVNGKASDIVFGLAGGDQVGTTLNIDGDANLFIREDDNEFEALTDVNVSSSGALDIDLGDNNNDINFAGGTGATTLVTGDGDSTIVTGGKGDSITVGSGDNNIKSGGGNDTVNIINGGNQTVDLGEGDDTINTLVSLTKDDKLDGGAGTDTLNANVYTLDLVSADPTFDASIANFEILGIGGAGGGVAQGDNLVVDLANLDDISRVVINTDLAAGTAVAEVQELELNSTGQFGGRFSIEGVLIEVPANLSQDDVRDYVIANYASDIIAAYNANHPGETMTSVVVGDNASGHIQFNYSQLSGDVPFPTFVDAGFTLSSGASFGAASTTVAGDNEDLARDHITVTTAPTATGILRITVAGTQVEVTLTAGQTIPQTATSIANAIIAANIPGVESVATELEFGPGNDAVLITYVSPTDPALPTEDTDATGTVLDIHQNVAYDAPDGETQTIAVNNVNTDADGGFITLSDGTDSITIELDGNLSQDQIGVFIASQQAAIIAEIPTIQAIGYDTLTNLLTFQYTTVAGDVPVLTITNEPGNFPSMVDHTDVDINGVDGDLDGTLLIDNLASNGTVTLSSNNGGLVTVAPVTSGSTEVLNVTIAAPYVYNSKGVYDFDGFETVKYTTQATTQELLTVDGTDATSITVSGTVGISFQDEFGDLTLFSNLTSFNASGITGSASAANKGVGVQSTTSLDANFVGGVGNDVLITGSGDDVINGGAGNDSITGGLGKDALTGGAGNDVFVFNDSFESNGVDTDTITDFETGTLATPIDKIDVGIAVTYTGAANGYGAVLTELNGLAGQAVYDSATRSLYIDVNGDADLTDADYKIDFSQAVTLTQSNFV